MESNSIIKIWSKTPNLTLPHKPPSFYPITCLSKHPTIRKPENEISLQTLKFTGNQHRTLLGQCLNQVPSFSTIIQLFGCNPIIIGWQIKPNIATVYRWEVIVAVTGATLIGAALSLVSYSKATLMGDDWIPPFSYYLAEHLNFLCNRCLWFLWPPKSLIQSKSTRQKRQTCLWGINL